MKVSTVIGALYGDEGKGITTDYLCSQADKPLVVRYSGGHQAGHTVNYNGIEHVFSNFGSGTLRGVPTYWSQYCTVEPIGLMNEFSVLKGKGINPIIYIDPECPVTTPFDVYHSRQDSKYIHNGTCGLGFGSTIQREKDHYSLKYKDLFYPSVFKLKLEQIIKYYDSWDLAVELENFFESVKEVISHPSNFEVGFLSKISFNDVIFEGSQGLLLDQNIGFFPHVTHSNTGMKNIFKIANTMRVDDSETYYVTRAYQTRHGNGPLSNSELPYHNIKVNPDETNKTNKYQGDFRRSVLDLDMLNYALLADGFQGKKSLVITCLDHVEGNWDLTYLDEVRTFDSEDKFVEFIANILNIDVDKVIRIRSPKTEDVSE